MQPCPSVLANAYAMVQTQVVTAVGNDSNGKGGCIELHEDVVTAIGIDSSGNVWTGHQKGLVRVRQKMQWDLVLSDKAFNLAIKCIAFDERQGTTWVGDEGGHVK
eukprot:scaffold52492_cov17-Tisochrysis_lutea.AAC.1